MHSMHGYIGEFSHQRSRSREAHIKRGVAVPNEMQQHGDRFKNGKKPGT